MSLHTLGLVGLRLRSQKHSPRFDEYIEDRIAIEKNGDILTATIIALIQIKFEQYPINRKIWPSQQRIVDKKVLNMILFNSNKMIYRYNV